MTFESDQPEWHQHAACAGAGKEKFFPTNTETSELASAAAAGKRICAGCPVRTECLDYATTRHITHGTWGGLNELERRILTRGAAT